MTGRPCKPGSDLHGLWRLLLPGTPFPACGVAEDSTADSSERVALAENSRDDEAPADAGEPQRQSGFINPLWRASITADHKLDRIRLDARELDGERRRG
jgi:hypothetical protein